MSSFSSLKTAIANAIKANGNQEITGNLLQGILLSIVETLGDSAINTLETGLSNEASTRGNADTTLQTNINNEATARGNADTQLNNLITGIKNNIDNGYVYAGIATPSTTPVSGKVFYIATKAGTYTNLGGLSVTEGITILKYNGSTWSKEQVIYGDGGAFDVTAQNGGATFASLEALLGSNNLSTLIPTAVRKGGMSIKFVQTSDNNYVRYNLLAQSFTTDTTQWAIDDNGIYVENPEFIAAWVDTNKKLLFAIENDGNVLFGYGVPKQIVDYVNTKVAEILEGNEGTQIDGLNKVTSFLEGFATDSTLMEYLDDNYGEYIENPEFIDAETDTDGRVIEAHKNNGDKYLGAGIEVEDNGVFHKNLKVEKQIEASSFKVLGKNVFEIPEISIDGVTEKTDDDPEGRIDIGIDKDNKVIHYHDKEGILHEEAGIKTLNVDTNSLNLSPEGMSEFMQALKDSGFDVIGKCDWSDYISEKGKKPLQLPIPDCAIINVSNEAGNATWPVNKGTDLVYYMEYWDKLGNYFKKNIVMNGQGRSSMDFIKKNASFKIFDNSVYNKKGKVGKGDKFGIRFGNWPVQTGFHAKAYYTDFFRGINVLCYTMMDNIWKNRGIYNDRPYKRFMLPSAADIGYSHSSKHTEINDIYLQVDNGARCIPDGFPVIMYLNGTFYGVFSWQLKKDQANYYMTKNNPQHIHLDGTLNYAKLFGANGDVDAIDFDPYSWAGFEIRNPEDIWTEDGEPYDADLTPHKRQVPVDSVTAEQWIANGSLPDGTEIDEEIAAQLRYSAIVRENILTLSTYIPTLKAMRTGGSTAEAIKAKIEEYFDVESIIDYILFSSISDNWDGFAANWQWTTWDGTKWALCPYDMDNTFGAMEKGNVLRDYTADKFYNNNRDLPSGWITTYYQAELKSRWQELVNAKIVTPDVFQAILMNWTERIGVDNFDKEYKKWNITPCNRASNQNADYWNYTGKYESGDWTPTGNIWDSATAYAIGDNVWFKVGRWYQFEAVAASTNQKPIKDEDLYTDGSPALGFRDSIYRVINTYNQHYTTFSEFINSLNV